jgi:hypothetical protein
VEKINKDENLFERKSKSVNSFFRSKFCWKEICEIYEEFIKFEIK